MVLGLGIFAGGCNKGEIGAPGGDLDLADGGDGGDLLPSGDDGSANGDWADGADDGVDGLGDGDAPDGGDDVGGDTGVTSAGTLVWHSGFETGFPGEWLDYDSGSWSADGSMPAGRVSAWTIDGLDGSVPPLFGDHVYKGWIIGSAAESHRAYPVLHCDFPTPVSNTFWVYLEADYAQMSSSAWIHFATWGNGHPDKWALHTMSVRDSKLEFAHVSPSSGEYIGPTPQPDFPRDRWVRFTAYLEYGVGNGFVQVWQDGVAVMRAEIPSLATYPGTHLQRAHWGMYASGDVAQGVQYNDGIKICTLDEPLVDLTTEPLCD